MLAAEYAPYSELLGRAAATVHQGGIGTTAQALRAGKPMLVVPYSHDQPDNAARVAQLGAGRVVRRAEYRAARVARELRAILSDPRYAEAARRVQQADMAQEDGVAAACRGLEALIQ
jgi:UDP:flavonoid glycosyltransferase YjiC (YdhE family)